MTAAPAPQILTLTGNLLAERTLDFARTVGFDNAWTEADLPSLPWDAVVDASNARAASAYHGMTRALLANMVAGVVKPFEKRLEIQGVGWNATMQGTKISLNVGYNKPVVLPIPKGLTVVCPDPTNIVITGCDRQVVGELAATIRRQRPPEPYQGKGVRYKGEYIFRKEGKKK